MRTLVVVASLGTLIEYLTMPSYDQSVFYTDACIYTFEDA